MAFRATNINPATEFKIAAAPYEAIGGAVEALTGGVTKIIEKAQEANRQKQAIELFKQMELGQMQNALGNVKDPQALPLALDLYKLSSAVATQRAQRDKAVIDLELNKAVLDTDRSTYGDPATAIELIKNIKPELTPLAGLKVSRYDPITKTVVDFTEKELLDFKVPNVGGQAAQALLKLLTGPDGNPISLDPKDPQRLVIANRVREILSLDKLAREEAAQRGKEYIEEPTKVAQEAMRTERAAATEAERTARAVRLKGLDAQTQTDLANIRVMGMMAALQQRLSAEKTEDGREAVRKDYLAKLRESTARANAILDQGYMPNIKADGLLDFESPIKTTTTADGKEQFVRVDKEEAALQKGQNRAVTDAAYYNRIQELQESKFIPNPIPGQPPIPKGGITRPAAVYQTFRYESPDIQLGYYSRKKDPDLINVMLMTELNDDFTVSTAFDDKKFNTAVETIGKRLGLTPDANNKYPAPMPKYEQFLAWRAKASESWFTRYSQNPEPTK